MNIQQWWQSAQPRERLFVGGGGTLALLILLYTFVFSPLLDQVSKVKTDITHKQNLHAWMQVTVNDLLTLRRSKPKGNAAESKALIIIERELKKGVLSGFSPQIKQGQKEEVQVSFNSAPFDEVVRWLGQLNQNHGLQVIAVVANKTEDAGMVRVSLTLAK